LKPNSTVYELHPSWWSKGLGSESVLAAANFAFDVLRVGKMVIDPVKGQLASVKLALGLGMKKEGEKMGGTQEVYSIRREEWYGGEGRSEPSYEARAPTCRWFVVFSISAWQVAKF